MRTTNELLPNGFSDGGVTVREIELRQLDGDDEDLIVDKSELRKGNMLHRILKRCITRIGGVTDPKKIEKILDSNFLLADTTFALIRLRIWSVGAVYGFEAQCSHCDKIGRHKIDLRTLEVTEQPEEFRGKDVYIDTVEAMDEKHVIEHRPLYTRDQVMMESIKENYPKEKATRELLLQLKTIDGNPVDIKALKKFPMGVRNAFRAAMDAKSGGIDVELESECGKCHRFYKHPLPFDVRPFFFQAGDLSKYRTSEPFRSSGQTPTDSDESSAGNQAKSDDSASKSESST